MARYVQLRRWAKVEVAVEAGALEKGCGPLGRRGGRNAGMVACVLVLVQHEVNKKTSSPGGTFHPDEVFVDDLQEELRVHECRAFVRQSEMGGQRIAGIVVGRSRSG